MSPLLACPLAEIPSEQRQEEVWVWACGVPRAQGAFFSFLVVLRHGFAKMSMLPETDRTPDFNFNFLQAFSATVGCCRS